MSSEILLKNKKYWESKLLNEFPRDYITNDKFEHNRLKHNLESHMFSLREDNFELLNRLCNNSNEKLQVVLIAGVASLLYKYSDETDVILCTSIEKQDDDKNLINTILPIRQTIIGKSIFKEVIISTKNLLIEAVEHQNYPVASILKIEKNDENKADALIDVAIILTNTQKRDYISELKANINFIFERNASDVVCTIEFNPGLYDLSSILNIGDKLVQLLSNVLSDLNKPLDQIEIVSEIEKVFLLNEVPQNYKFSRSVNQIIEENAKSNPNQVAIIDRELKLTYSQFYDKVDRISHIIHSQGIKKGDVVAIYTNRMLNSLISIFGILKCGAIYLPIDTSLPKERLKYILEDSNAKLVVIDNESPELIENRFKKIDVKEIDNLTKDDLYIHQIEIESDDHAYIIYTSGTTGNPKGVVINHGSLDNYIRWAAQKYIQGERLNFALFTSTSYDLTVTSIFTPLYTGNAIKIFSDADINVTLQNIMFDPEVQLIKLTPTHLKIALGLDIKNKLTIEQKKSSIKKMILGGEDLSVQLAKEVYESFNSSIEIYNEYGPTEATVGCMIHKYNNSDDNAISVPIGKPIDNMEIFILDKNEQLSFPGKVGELYIAGIGLAEKYLNKDDLTKEKFRFIKDKRVYKTGDLAKYNSNGEVIFLGRKDMQIKIRGNRVEPEEIENRIRSINGIKEIAVVDKTKNGDVEYLVGFYTGDSSITPEIIKSYLSAYLPEYMIPSYFIELSGIPLTKSGKLDKKVLQSYSLPKTKEFTPPENEMEHRLVAIWASVLDVEIDLISTNSTFFDLGGHSIKAVFLLSRLNKELGINISLTQLFQSNTIKSLANLISVIDISIPESQLESAAKYVV